MKLGVVRLYENDKLLEIFSNFYKVNQLEIILERLDQIESSLSSEKTLLNIDEVSILTGISKSTLYKLTSAREIPHYKKAKHLLFDKKEILEWIKASRVKTIDEIDNDSSAWF